MGLHLKSCIGLTGVSRCLHDPLISRCNSLPEGLFKIETLSPGRFTSNTIEPIQADCRASETGSSLEAVGFRKQTTPTPELDNPGDKPFYPHRVNHCHPYG